jgi:hypothetical protein
MAACLWGLLCVVACNDAQSTLNVSLVAPGSDNLNDRVRRLTQILSPKNNVQVARGLKDLGTVGTFLSSEGFRQVSASVVGLVAQGGGTIVSQGGGNLVAQGGGTIVSQGGGNLVAQGGGTIVSQGGGNLVAQGGGTIVSQGGGNLIGELGGIWMLGSGSALATASGSARRHLLLDQVSADGKVTVTYNERTGVIERVRSDLGEMKLMFPAPVPANGSKLTRSIRGEWDQVAEGIKGNFRLDWTGVWKPRAAIRPKPVPSVTPTCLPVAPPTLQPNVVQQTPLPAPAGSPLPQMVLFDGELPETTEKASLTAKFEWPGDRAMTWGVVIDTPKAFKDGSIEPSRVQLDLTLADTEFVGEVTDADGETRANGRLTVKNQGGRERYRFDVVAPDEGEGSLIIYSLDERDQAFFKVEFKLLPPVTPCGPRSFTGALFKPDSKGKLVQKFADCLPVPENPNQLLIRYANGQTLIWDFLTVAASQEGAK